MLRVCTILLVSFLATPILAVCDFKQGEVISELQSPANISNITITVPKSAKWQKNAMKILRSDTLNIRSEFKKSFKAKFKINYTFGSCEFWGSIKQSGDWKDHISFKEGNMIRSLNARLDNGNILNSVRFKLLLPETRNGLKEVFGVSVLNSLGFITPETFQVNVSVNGINSIMIFQENFRKELLERNGRREGPLFEGDESLIWGYGRLEENNDVSLSRLENKSWFLKGSNSQKITLRAFNTLQAAYMLRANKSIEMRNYFDPNILLPFQSTSSLKFPKFNFVIQALGAEHALFFHNRKFYFNVFDGSFEPIYYDGNVLGKRNYDIAMINIPNEQEIVRYAYKGLDVEQYSSSARNQKVKLNAKKHFIERSGLPQNYAVELFEKYWRIFAIRTKNLQQEIKEAQSSNEIKSWQITATTNLAELDIFLTRASKHPSIGALGVGLLKISDETYLLEFEDQQTEIISVKELANILGKNSLKGTRVTLLSDNTNSDTINLTRRKFQDGEIITSAGIIIVVDDENRTVSFEQQNSTDWALLNSVILEDWNVKFVGLSQGSQTKEEQRFNEFGMTGCLNFYNSSFINVDLSVYSGECEDSLNIVKSTGNLASIKIVNAFSDAVDIDFSNISIYDLVVNTAGNDCFDASGGRYQISRSTLHKCDDKGISVGESSYLTATEINLTSANIGISSKDYSKVNVLRAKIEDVTVCVEVKQKKQEFGGASLLIEDLMCDGIVKVDKHSVFKAGLR